MRSRFFEILAFVPLLCGFTHFGDLASWQAVVGPHALEDFESYAEMRLPIEGGSIVLDHFAVENDDQGNNEWSGPSGLWLGSHFDPAIPDTMNLIISTEPFGDPESAGPFFIDAVFPQPIIAYALEYSWCEDEDCVFDGVVLGAPTTRISLWELGGCEHSWCAIEAIRWAPATVPEPTSAALLGLGLIGLASARRRRT